MVIGDGAPWIWNLTELQFPGANPDRRSIHADQHLWAFAAFLFPQNEARQRRWAMVQQHRPDSGQVAKIVASLHSLMADSPHRVEALRLEVEYFAATPSACAIPSFVNRDCSSAPS